MNRPFNLKFDNIVWEENDAAFEAWKEGKTGFPIVDAVSLFSFCYFPFWWRGGESTDGG